MAQENRPSQAAVTVVDALYILGWTGSREKLSKTASNLIARNRFPVPIQKIGFHKRVLISDIAKITTRSEVDTRTIEPKIIQEESRGRGRPRKGSPS